ncbi:MAG: ABC transporter permease [Chitinophagales bacterium]|nr:ABC transporter permease [Chitinophagales bacterium]
MNGNAMFGVVTIFYALILFIFGHFIAPDPSAHAANQINELTFKKPGFTIQLLHQPLERAPVKTGFLEYLIYGKKSNVRYIPIHSYRFIKDSLYVDRYLGDGVGEQIGFKLDEIGVPQNKSIIENQKIIEKKYIETKRFYFGTDDLGRDYLSRIIIGTRVSLAVGFVAVIIALFIGIPLGAIAGFYKKLPFAFKFSGRKLKINPDDMIMWFMNVIWSIPALLLVFPIVFAFGQQFYTIFIAVGLTMWVDIARIVRGQVLQVREMEYIQATKSFGFSDFRTILKHILPNIMGPVIVITAANFAYAILTEAGLSFLGIGVQPPAPSWGLMISKYKDNLITDPYLTFFPGIAITLLVLAFFMIGNGIRDALDVKTQIEN